MPGPPPGRTDPAVAIDVRGLRKSFEDPDGGLVEAVTDGTLTCVTGEVCGLLGPNGAGKTTTLRCLATILRPTGGTARVAGYDVVAEPEAVRRNIGFLAAGAGLYGRLTPRETLHFYGGMYGLRGAELEGRVEQMLSMFDIQSYADRPVDRLSTGMKQRVSIARAVVHDPPVLILDEPTNGLDPVVTQAVEASVRRLAEDGKCVLFSTHVLSQAEDLCHRLAIIARGRVVAEGTVAELLERTGTASLRAAFFALVGESSDAA